MRLWLYRLARIGPWLWLLVPLVSWARGGGGENYNSGRGERPPSTHGDDGGEGFAYLAWWLLRLTFEHPKVMCPLIVIGGVAYYFWQRSHDPTTTTRRAFEQREAELRTQVSFRDVEGWVNALKLKDPRFDLTALLEKVQTLFLQLQDCWFKRDLSPLRPFLSDATFRRFNVQLKLMQAQGVRDAITDIQVLDLQLIGLGQSEWFDTVNIRVKAQMRDADVPAAASDAEAIAAARRAPIEPFTEVWSFVRKPGTQTKIGEDLYQGKCPNCGAPFRGGASNACEYCGAVVNSGNYDWTLSEITQGVEHVPYYTTVDGLLTARESDPALNLEILEDRASLIFWKWIDAQSSGDLKWLVKLALGTYVKQLESELAELSRRGRRKVFLECAVGAVITRLFRRRDGFDEAHVEIRWSARMGIGPVNQQPPELPSIPQRSVFTLVRRAGAQTRTENGMSTDRCSSCSAPLTDSLSPSCDYCGNVLSAGDRDWVLASALSYEAWNASEEQHYREVTSRASSVRSAEVIIDSRERERLLYMMAALASADGEVDGRERKLLKLCSDRWSVSWENVEKALAAGPTIYDRLMPKQSPEAETFLRTLVGMALVDGRIDRKERRMLESVALHLGMADRLPTMLERR